MTIATTRLVLADQIALDIAGVILDGGRDSRAICSHEGSSNHSAWRLEQGCPSGKREAPAGLRVYCCAGAPRARRNSVILSSTKRQHSSRTPECLLEGVALWGSSEAWLLGFWERARDVKLGRSGVRFLYFSLPSGRPLRPPCMDELTRAPFSDSLPRLPLYTTRRLAAKKHSGTAREGRW